ncbi:hypothetical protein TWF481_010155 [Arthrobotrys musiformis]|uniref:Uncharacterized protein n=1 Tax=Arthrobotrys musiformis TaxID=47236 RepID=A0AAV9W1V9_9PEZI
MYLVEGYQLLAVSIGDRGWRGLYDPIVKNWNELDEESEGRIHVELTIQVLNNGQWMNANYSREAHMSRRVVTQNQLTRQIKASSLMKRIQDMNMGGLKRSKGLKCWALLTEVRGLVNGFGGSLDELAQENGMAEISV